MGTARRMALRRVAYLLGACVLVAWVGAPAREARGEDPALAEFLLKAGRTAFEKGDYDDAFSKLKKSAEESLQDFEVQYWLAITCEKREDLPLAVGYYRLFLRNVDGATKASVLPAGYGPLAKKARQRLDILAAATTERSKLDEALAAKLVALAGKHKASNPEAAKRAARWAWRLVGEAPEVRALLEQLDEDPRPRESQGPADPDIVALQQEEPRKPFEDLPAVTHGKNMLYQRVFGRHEHWSWDKGVVTIDCPDMGQLAWPVVEQTVGGRFIVELEGRVLAEHDAKWAVGPAFGQRDAFIAVFFMRSQIVISRAVTGGGFKDLTGVGMTAIDPMAWHRLAVRVDGTQLTVWLDGKQMIDHTMAQPLEATTGVGLWYQRAKVELRSLRHGALP